MAGPQEIWFVCPRCGASNLADAPACFLCGRRIDPDSPPSPPPSLPVNPYNPPAVDQGGRGFRLDSMLLVIALIAVCMGVIREAPGLGIPLAVISFIAYVRTVMYTPGGGRPATLGDRVAVFFATVGVVVIVLVCVAIALLATCFAICAVAIPAENRNVLGGLPFGVPAILLGAVVLIGLLMWGATQLRRVGEGRRDRPGRGPRPPAPR